MNGMGSKHTYRPVRANRHPHAVQYPGYRGDAHRPAAQESAAEVLAGYGSGGSDPAMNTAANTVVEVLKRYQDQIDLRAYPTDPFYAL